MGLLSWIILGGLAGWLASVITKGGSSGLLANIAIGIVGSLIGGFVMNILTKGQGHGVTDFSFASFGVALLGSVILIWIVKAIRK